MNMIPLILMIACLQAPEEPSPELKASMALGARSAAVQRAIPIVNQVVLVPDEQTYLNEISKWSIDGQWPVLFDKEPFASQFIRKFQPEKIWRRSPYVDQEATSLKNALRQTAAKAWGGTDSISTALKNINRLPLGVVFTSEKDPARTAAVALATGYGQLLKFIGDDWGAANSVLSATGTSTLVRRVDAALQETNYPYAELGDTIDAITMCMTLPSRVNNPTSDQNPVAVSDVIGRSEDGSRFAWTGWIFGSKTEAAYAAMSSLFLDRTQYWFCNTYPQSGSWELYGFGNLPNILPNFGIDTTVVEGTLSALQTASVGGVNADVVFMTSKGNMDFFDMSDTRSSPAWIPILDTPAALTFIHSWSLKNPADRYSVGGTWLSRGVYAYVGSSHEPMLNAFVPPSEVIRRTMSMVPFLPASRWHDGQSFYSKPWRVNTIGDPLMLCPQNGAAQRQMRPASNDETYSDLLEETKIAMQAAQREGTDQQFADAIALTNLLCRDELTLGLWNNAMEQQVAGILSAKRALPAFFRLEKQDQFVWAFRLLVKPSRLDKDMLWQLCGNNPRTPIDVLVKNIRPLFSCDDIACIAQRIIETQGKQQLVQLISTSMQHAKGRNSRELQRMRKQYGG